MLRAWFVKKRNGTEIEIVLGGVYGKHGGIFTKKILFSRRKNPNFANFAARVFINSSKI